MRAGGMNVVQRASRWRGVVLASTLALLASFLGVQVAAAEPATLSLSIDKTTVYQGDSVGISGAGVRLAAVVGHDVTARLDGPNGREVPIRPFGSTPGWFAKVRAAGNGSVYFRGVIYLFRDDFAGIATGRHTLYVQTFPTSDHSGSPSLVETLGFDYVAGPIPGPYVTASPSTVAPGGEVTVTFEHISAEVSPRVQLHKDGPNGSSIAQFDSLYPKYFTTEASTIVVPADAAPGKYWVGYHDEDRQPVGTTLTVSGGASSGIFGSLG